MERHEVIDLVRERELVGMKAAYDEVLSNALKRQHAAQDSRVSFATARTASSRDCRPFRFPGLRRTASAVLGLDDSSRAYN